MYGGGGGGGGSRFAYRTRRRRSSVVTMTSQTVFASRERINIQYNITTDIEEYHVVQSYYDYTIVIDSLRLFSVSVLRNRPYTSTSSGELSKIRLRGRSGPKLSSSRAWRTYDLDECLRHVCACVCVFSVYECACVCGGTRFPTS